MAAEDLWLPDSAIQAKVLREVRREVEGFYDFRFGVAGDYPDFCRINPKIPRAHAVFAAKREMTGGYPPVQHVLPILDSTLEAYKRGDPSVLQALGSELVEAHQRFMLMLGT